MSSELKKASVGPVFIGGIFIFLIFGLLIVIWFRWSGKADSYDDQRAVVRAAKLDQLQKDNHEKLTSYAWVNKQKGIVQLPIDRAMEVVIADLKAKPVKASAVKLEVPYPAGLQQAPAAAAPAAPAAPGAAPAASAAPVPSQAAATSGSAAPAAPAPSPAPAAASPAPAAASASPVPASSPSPVPVASPAAVAPPTPAPAASPATSPAAPPVTTTPAP